ncbi:MAG TPA: SRPBCC domain-containing protein [Steroidobacteraceae bacterium]|nr:SRPBCC domain-containing protein [Steroidobacteraceae bacterium]
MPARIADDSRTLRIERRFDAPRELVFDAWTQPEYLMRWYAPHGCTIQLVKLEARPGGRFHWCIHNPSFGECWCVGEYQEMVRPERIVYTLATADSAGNQIEPAQAGHDPRWPRESLVTVTLADVRGSTLLTLEQNVLESLAKHTGAHPSWLQMLERLDEIVAVRKAGHA